jgi:hypothetical protein
VVSSEPDPEIVELLRRRQAKLRRAIGALVVGALGGTLAHGMLSTRVVTIVGPTGNAAIAVDDEDPVAFPERVGLILELRPGAHEIRRGDVVHEFRVPLWSRGVIVPAREDHCLVVASAAGAYVLEGSPIPARAEDAFHVFARSASSYALPTSTRVVIDPCLLPWEREILDDVHVAYAVPCDQAPADDAEAASVLLDRMLTCS